MAARCGHVSARPARGTTGRRGGSGGRGLREGAWPRRAAAGPGRAGAGRRDAVGVVTAGVTAMRGWGRGLGLVGVVTTGVTAL